MKIFWKSSQYKANNHDPFFKTIISQNLLNFSVNSIRHELTTDLVGAFPFQQVHGTDITTALLTLSELLR
jgi:hypothetical protein